MCCRMLVGYKELLSNNQLTVRVQNICPANALCGKLFFLQRNSSRPEWHIMFSPLIIYR